MSRIQKEIIFDVQNLPNSKIINHILPSAIILNYVADTGSEEFERLVNFWLANGAVHFATTGVNANKIEDAIDWIIVDGNNSDVVTTTHLDETPQEALEFVLLHMGLNFDAFRVIFVSDTNNEISDQWKVLIEEKKKGLR